MHDASNRIISILYKMYTAANRSADSSRDIFSQTFMSRAFPATSLSSTGYRVPEICDLWKSDGVEFRRGTVRTINRSDLLNSNLRNWGKIHSEAETYMISPQYDYLQLFTKNAIQMKCYYDKNLKGT